MSYQLLEGVFHFTECKNEETELRKVTATLGSKDFPPTFADVETVKNTSQECGEIFSL